MSYRGLIEDGSYSSAKDFLQPLPTGRLKTLEEAKFSNQTSQEKKMSIKIVYTMTIILPTENGGGAILWG